MRLKLFIGSAITAAVLSVAGPASAGGTTGGTTGGTDCSNTNFGSISVGQGTAQCNNVTATPFVNLSPTIKL